MILISRETEPSQVKMLIKNSYKFGSISNLLKICVAFDAFLGSSYTEWRIYGEARSLCYVLNLSRIASLQVYRFPLISGMLSD